MKNIVRIFLIFSILMFAKPYTVKAETTWHPFTMVVYNNGISTSSASYYKTDPYAAAIQIDSGIWLLSGNVYLRVRYTPSGNPASELIVTSGNGRYNLSYLPNYGDIGDLNHFNSSKEGGLNVTLKGTWAP